ncbi:MAG: radical SAM family heme chaperone HemW [Pseudomonadota bacterium]
MSEDWRHGGFGLYIHWPFCQAKCPYCDFNSHVVARIDQQAWAEAYVSEIARVGAETEGHVLQSVFFGGGTPSLMDPDVVDQVLEAVRRTWPIANSIEITLEANPTSVEAGRFAAYRAAGVNRVSMGVQALNDADLRALGRLHTAAEAMEAFEIARDVFERVSFDLIYARQGRSAADWAAELRQALSLAVDHLSLYQLTIEDGTAFGDRFAAGKLRGLPDEDLGADLYDLTQEICADAGFANYEISNHARPGAESVHNRIYWQSGDYAGIGPGAHGRLTFGALRYATETVLAPGAWLQQVREMGTGELPREALDREARLSEFLLMGMRLTDGVDLSRFPELASGIYLNNIKRLCEDGLIERADQRLRLTPQGRPLLNAILRQLLAD